MATSGDRHRDRETARPGEAASDADDEQPAAEHLLKAAQELLLAAKAVVDVGERAVEAHRSAADATGTDKGEDTPYGRGRVRHIDLA